MTEFNELEKKKSQFLSRLKKRLERMCVHTRHTHTHTHTHQDPSHYAVSPTPTITQQDTKSIVILYLPGAAWEVWLTLILIQHRRDKRIAPEESLPKKKACLFTSHFLLENINPRENHLQFASHACKYFLNFYLDCSPWSELAFPRECEVYLSPPKLEM